MNKLAIILDQQLLPSFLNSLARSLNILRLSSSVAKPTSVLRAPVEGYVFKISAIIETHGSPSTKATSRISSNSTRHWKNHKITALEIVGHIFKTAVSRKG